MRSHESKSELEIKAPYFISRKHHLDFTRIYTRQRISISESIIKSLIARLTSRERNFYADISFGRIFESSILAKKEKKNNIKYRAPSLIHTSVVNIKYAIIVKFI